MQDSAVSDVGRANAGLSSGRGAQEEIDSRVGLDEGGLDAVQRSGVGEDDAAFRKTQRVLREEFDAIRSEARDIICRVTDLEREVVDSFASSADEPGYRAVRIV